MTARRAFLVAYTMIACFAYAMDVTSPCICGRVRRASRTLSRLYDEALTDVGLNINQFAVLRTLARLGPSRLVDLAEATLHEKSALWRTLQPLIRQGWVVAEATPGARGQTLDLTPEGVRKLADALPHWTTAQTRVAALLGPREAALIDLLSELEANA